MAQNGLTVLALSIDSSVAHKEFIVTITYVVVVFSVIGQGLTLNRLIRRLYPEG